MKTLTFLEDENKVVIDGKTFVCVEDEPKVKFEVKKWYFNTKYNTTYRVTAIRDNVIYYVSYKHGEANQKSFILGSEWASTSHLATKEEIESHLRKICDEKYIGKKVKCLAVGEYWISEYGNYEFNGDWLWYKSNNNSNVLIYHQGKFAEILPDKKHFPKNRIEAEQFINAFRNRKQYCDISEFLNDYSDCNETD